MLNRTTRKKFKQGKTFKEAYCKMSGHARSHPVILLHHNGLPLQSVMYWYIIMKKIQQKENGLRQANLVLIAYASSEGSGEPAHPRSLARTSAARSYKQ